MKLLGIESLFINTQPLLKILFWSQIGVNVAIISASAPCLRPLFATVFKSSSYVRSYRGPSNDVYGAYGTRSNRRTLRPRTEGAIELTSRDDENYHRVEVNVSGANPANGGDGSEERIPGSQARKHHEDGYGRDEK
ncbi:hypothetical protein PENSUB_2671 [Penicillium subrubescens]|uniref:Uncharacterized protein n=1 Tax=Penicillium subrubescens TaxID=1316194 RepID=A0A1Q5UH40_9EURO|nr:hypothetical protein PENSUB_2671 [Penicillium subrubescens]